MRFPQVENVGGVVEWKGMGRNVWKGKEGAPSITMWISGDERGGVPGGLERVYLEEGSK